MSKIDKMLGQMRHNPKDWRIDSLEGIAKRIGMKVRKSGGSHVVFMHDSSDLIVTVPAKRPIKPIYIKQFLVLVNEIGAL